MSITRRVMQEHTAKEIQRMLRVGLAEEALSLLKSSLQDGTYSMILATLTDDVLNSVMCAVTNWFFAPDLTTICVALLKSCCSIAPFLVPKIVECGGFDVLASFVRETNDFNDESSLSYAALEIACSFARIETTAVMLGQQTSTWTFFLEVYMQSRKTARRRVVATLRGFGDLGILAPPEVLGQIAQSQLDKDSTMCELLLQQLTLAAKCDGESLVPAQVTMAVMDALQKATGIELLLVVKCFRVLCGWKSHRAIIMNACLQFRFNTVVQQLTAINDWLECLRLLVRNDPQLQSKMADVYADAFREMEHICLLLDANRNQILNSLGSLIAQAFGDKKEKEHRNDKDNTNKKEDNNDKDDTNKKDDSDKKDSIENKKDNVNKNSEKRDITNKNSKEKDNMNKKEAGNSNMNESRDLKDIMNNKKERLKDALETIKQCVYIP